jgi:hypothetical protein
LLVPLQQILQLRVPSTVLPLPPHHIGAPLDAAAAAPRFAASSSTVLLLLLPISPSPLLPANPLSPRIKFAFFSFEGVAKKKCSRKKWFRVVPPAA